MTDPPLLQCFPPIVRGDTKLLILGSLPGAVSLAAGRYYAHPRNQFWRLVDGIIEEPVSDLDYETRLERLVARGIGLWDTVASAHRPGSLDADISLQEASDLAGLTAGLSALRAIAFNGGTSARIGRRQLAGSSKFDLIDLPSSSPAYTLPFEAKLRAWSQLRRYL